MKYLITRFLSDETLENIHRLLSLSEWEDGLKSVNFRNGLSLDDKYAVKNNLQTHLPNEIIFSEVDKCTDFLNFVLPITSTPPTISKTITGGYYRPHFDHIDNGHFSVTIFLNDPKNYDGGELCLFNNGKEEKIKLNAGYGVIYETGVTHCVNTVTRGERIVSVFWSKTRIPDMKELYKYRYYKSMAQRYELPNKPYLTCQDFVSNLNNHFTEKCNKIMRRWI